MVHGNSIKALEKDIENIVHKHHSKNPEEHRTQPFHEGYEMNGSKYTEPKEHPNGNIGGDKDIERPSGIGGFVHMERTSDIGRDRDIGAVPKVYGIHERVQNQTNMGGPLRHPHASRMGESTGSPHTDNTVRRLVEGKAASKRNTIFGADAQVVLKKTARYFDIESRLVPVSDDSRYSLDIHKALEIVDENTIGMYVILGTTYTGHFEQVAEMSQLLEKLKAETGLDISIHVDGASDAFAAPFAFPDLKWDFDVPHVVSISTSGHKFGLTYPGIGWVLWRSAKYLPNDLTFELAYLGGLEKAFTLNFSHPTCFLIAQYYNFIRFGRKGYTRIMNS
ncbi:glutamate decarboxylase gad1, partial [Linderina macrospora]